MSGHGSGEWRGRAEGAHHPKPGTQTVDRSVAVLRSFEDAPRQTPTEIAHRTGLSVSTAHRIVHALHATGMLAQDPVTERYFLGPTTAILGRLALERMGATLLQPELTALRDRTGEAVSLGVRAGDEVAVLLHLTSTHALRYEQPPGDRNPIHTCAMGKTLLAFGGGPVAMDEPFRRFTPATLTTRAALDADLRRVRDRGYAVNDEERLPGVRAVAAPVRDGGGRVFAAVALQGPSVRFGDDRLPGLADAVRAAAGRLTDLHRHLSQPPGAGARAGAGRAPALELLERAGVQAIHDHDVALARRFRAALGLPPGGAFGESAIVSVAVPDGTAELLRAGGVIASVRAGRLRCAFHLTTTEADVDKAAGLPAGLVAPAA